MARDAAPGPGGFLLGLPLNDAMANAEVFDRGWNAGLPFRWGTVGHGGQAQRREYPLTAEDIEWLTHHAFDGQSQENEADIAVFGMGSGVGNQGRRQGLAEKFIPGRGGLEQFHVGRKSRGVGEQHAQSDLLPAGIAMSEFPKNFRHRRFRF